jgi:hypothetical protein
MGVKVPAFDMLSKTRGVNYESDLMTAFGRSPPFEPEVRRLLPPGCNDQF